MIYNLSIALKHYVKLVCAKLVSVILTSPFG